MKEMKFMREMKMNLSLKWSIDDALNIREILDS